ncbi:hypothetical protein [Geodermatophilus marinus]|nr:hypothetical protein [Geodermatophilus sp. LHW52908]
MDVARHYAVFGASGALVATALTGLLAVPAVRRATGPPVSGTFA